MKNLFKLTVLVIAVMAIITPLTTARKTPVKKPTPTITIVNNDPLHALTVQHRSQNESGVKFNLDIGKKWNKWNNLNKTVAAGTSRVFEFTSNSSNQYKLVANKTKHHSSHISGKDLVKHSQWIYDGHGHFSFE